MGGSTQVTELRGGRRGIGDQGRTIGLNRLELLYRRFNQTRNIGEALLGTNVRRVTRHEALELTILAGIFFLSAALLVYVYAGDPLLACALGRLLRRHVRPAPGSPYQPTVTVVIAARGLTFSQFLLGRRQVMWKPRT